MNDSWTRLVVVVVASFVLTVAQPTPDLNGDLLDRTTTSLDLWDTTTRQRETFAHRGSQHSSLGIVQASMQKQKQHYPMASMIMNNKINYATKPNMNKNNQPPQYGSGPQAPGFPDPHNVRPIMGTYSKVRMMGSKNDIFAGMKPNPNRWANMNMGMGVPMGNMMMTRANNGAGGNMRDPSKRSKGMGATKGMFQFSHYARSYKHERVLNPCV